MSPFSIDEEKMAKRVALDISKPQTAGEFPADALPVKSIPILEFPRCIYKHPREPFRTIVHRNDKQEVVREEVVATEHLTKIVNSQEELDAAISEGWELKPYIPQAPPDPDAHLYERKSKR